ncbi:MAG: hypothetical protein ACR2QU_12640 [Gammaproteobacteria bacterium]
MSEENAKMEIQMSVDDLYQEEVFTDRRIGTMQRLTPVDADGAPDNTRSVLYVGQTQVMTPAGSLPLSFEVPADSLAAAVAGFGAAAETAVQDTMKKLEEMRREAASSIIVPGSEGGGGAMPGAGGGIRMP